MPELPEVHTTVEGLKKVVVGQTIKDVWSDFHINTSHGNRETIKNKKYFLKFKKLVTEAKIKSVERWGKNILINLNNKYTIVIHMKMTGHLMVGEYSFQNYIPKKQNCSASVPCTDRRAEQSKFSAENYACKASRSNFVFWEPVDEGPLQDSYNQFIHLVFSLSNNKHLVLSDMRKFASVTVFETDKLNKHKSLSKLGPDPLDKKFNGEKFFEIIHSKKNAPIKSALLDQSAVAGIGNIYSDEILWQTGIHPLSHANKIPKKKFGQIFKVTQEILRFSMSCGGDSKSDYRNIFGRKGGFQDFHQVYGRKGKKCPKKGCGGIIERVVIRGRSSHFCPKHQINYHK